MFASVRLRAALRAARPPFFHPRTGHLVPLPLTHLAFAQLLFAPRFHVPPVHLAAFHLHRFFPAMARFRVPCEGLTVLLVHARVALTAHGFAFVPIRSLHPR